MNYIKHLTLFFDRIETDAMITPHHISLYLVLFNCWNKNYFENPVTMARKDIMRLAKIGSAHTYRKCILDLHENGYLDYKPSFNPHKSSAFYMNIFDTGAETEEATQSKSDTATCADNAPIWEQKCTDKGAIMPPYINNKNNTNSIYKAVSDLTQVKNDNKSHGIDLSIPRNIDEAVQYFIEQNSTKELAIKFINHYQSTGWKKGNSKIEDWQAAAKNYILNANTFHQNKSYTPQPAHLHINQQKDYSEPL